MHRNNQQKHLLLRRFLSNLLRSFSLFVVESLSLATGSCAAVTARNCEKKKQRFCTMEMNCFFCVRTWRIWHGYHDTSALDAFLCISRWTAWTGHFLWDKTSCNLSNLSRLQPKIWIARLRLLAVHKCIWTENCASAKCTLMFGRPGAYCMTACATTICNKSKISTFWNISHELKRGY